MSRWISGIILASIVVVLLIYAPVNLCRAIVVLLSALGAWEFFTMAGLTSWVRLAGVAGAMTGTAALIWFQGYSLGYYLVGVALVISSLEAMSRLKNSPATSVQGFAYCFLGLGYIVFGFSGIGRLFAGEHFRFWVFLTLGANFLGDTMAYLTGKNFGTKKIIPHVSPSKTAEGFVGAIFGGVAGAVILKSIFAVAIPTPKIVLLGGLIAIVGAFGDLIESALKRGFGVKDSGKLIPGHGGILDRVDSLLLAAPFVAAWKEFFL